MQTECVRRKTMPDQRNFQKGGGKYDAPGPQALPPVTIASFYKDGTKTPKDDLFRKTAEEIAKTFYINDKIYVSKTQIRRIFDEVKRFERILDISEDQQWEAQKPYIKMIDSKVSYAVARAIENKDEKVKTVYKNLQSFVTQGIEKVNDAKDFRVFLSLFEAVYGFYYEINHNRD
jgi:CRISPR-associated protein Csm2